MDKAISMLKLESVPDACLICTGGRKIYYDPKYVIERFKKGSGVPAREYLHMLIHGIYSHFWTSSLVNRKLWDLSCHITAECAVNDMQSDALKTPGAKLQKDAVRRISKNVKCITADMLYKCFMLYPPLESLKLIFAADNHNIWYNRRLALKKRPKIKTTRQTGGFLFRTLCVLNRLKP